MSTMAIILQIAALTIGYFVLSLIAICVTALLCYLVGLYLWCLLVAYKMWAWTPPEKFKNGTKCSRWMMISWAWGLTRQTCAGFSEISTPALIITRGDWLFPRIAKSPRSSEVQP